MQRKKLNPWSVVAMLSAVGMCPIFSIASILLGIRALVDIKAKGDTRGAGLAWAAILVGSLVTGLWGGGMLWWNKNVRSNIEQGPIVAIMYAQDERVDLFEEALAIRTAKDFPFERALTILNQLELYWLINNEDKEDENNKYNDMLSKTNEIFNLVDDKTLLDKAKNHLEELKKLKSIME